MKAPFISLAFLTFLSSPFVRGDSYNVTVGGSSLTFDPPTVSAGIGDIVSFMFGSGSHSVVQSTFDAPCQAKMGGFATAFEAEGATYDLTVNSTDPIWIHCSQASHCQSGMVFAINPPTNGSMTFQAFENRAKGAASSTTAVTTGTTQTSNATATSHASSTTTTSKSGAISRLSEPSFLGVTGALLLGGIAAVMVI